MIYRERADLLLPIGRGEAEWPMCFFTREFDSLWVCVSVLIGLELLLV